MPRALTVEQQECNLTYTHTLLGMWLPRHAGIQVDKSVLVKGAPERNSFEYVRQICTWLLIFEDKFQQPVFA